MVRCADCGFLALRHNPSRALVETEEYFRKEGHPHATQEAVFGRLALPLCFARRADLPEEIESIEPETTLNACKVLAVIKKDRRCRGGFINWRPESTPKDHREVQDRKREHLWRIIEAVALVIVGGVVALFGTLFQRGAIPDRTLSATNAPTRSPRPSTPPPATHTSMRNSRLRSTKNTPPTARPRGGRPPASSPVPPGSRACVWRQSPACPDRRGRPRAAPYGGRGCL